MTVDGTRNALPIAALRREIDLAGARPVEIDVLVAQLDFADPGLSAALLSLLSDEAADDEGMFSLIHAAEQASDEAYVAALLRVLPGLLESAPRWASIVLMRVLNNRATQAALVQRVRDVDEDGKSAIRDLCARIDAVSPTFLSKTVPVVVAAS